LVFVVIAPADEVDDMLHVQKFIGAVKDLVKEAIETTRCALTKGPSDEAAA
jgi:hypothetical protein